MSNLFVARGTPILKTGSSERWLPEKTLFSRNLYWCEDGAVRFDSGRLTLATQPFAQAYAAEVDRFLPLPADGALIGMLAQAGSARAPVADAGSFRFACDGQALTLTGSFVGAAMTREASSPIRDSSSRMPATSRSNPTAPRAPSVLSPLI